MRAHQRPTDLYKLVKTLRKAKLRVTIHTPYFPVYSLQINLILYGKLADIRRPSLRTVLIRNYSNKTSSQIFDACPWSRYFCSAWMSGLLVYFFWRRGWFVTGLARKPDLMVPRDLLTETQYFRNFTHTSTGRNLAQNSALKIVFGFLGKRGG